MADDTTIRVMTPPSAERWPVDARIVDAQQGLRLHLLSKRVTDTDACSIDNALFVGDDLRAWCLGGEGRDDEIAITSTHVQYAITVLDRLEVGRLVAVLSLWLSQTSDR